ncbi:hypothetical protein [uncultured Pontibacter sp.]|uniref:hypothetical protein n=1 Tax=uncultured Pontibacter sp. TaxID=453356 RepID=UPI00260F1F3E|nr:hypothetical protein [uncultured Pontibacter sp.]
MCLSDPGLLLAPEGAGAGGIAARPARITYLVLFSFCLNNLSKNLPESYSLRLTRCRVILSFQFPVRAVRSFAGCKGRKHFPNSQQFISVFFSISQSFPRGFSSKRAAKVRNISQSVASFSQEIFRSFSASFQLSALVQNRDAKVITLTESATPKGEKISKFFSEEICLCSSHGAFSSAFSLFQLPRSCRTGMQK